MKILHFNIKTHIYLYQYFKSSSLCHLLPFHNKTVNLQFPSQIKTKTIVKNKKNKIK